MMKKNAKLLKSMALAAGVTVALIPTSALAADGDNHTPSGGGVL